MIINNDGLIERIVRKKISISALSRILDVSRTSIYNWFQLSQLPLDVVCKIGYAINYDFGNDFPDAFAKEGDRIMANLVKKKMDDAQCHSNSVQYWMNKYINLLEIHNELLNTIHSPANPSTIPGAMLSGTRNTRLYHPMPGH